MKEPYRLLFPIGLISAVAGVALWPLAAHRLIDIYPVRSHGGLLFFGFLWSFVAGFLLTAVPRMTGTDMARRRETLLAASLAVGQLFLNLTFLWQWADGLYILQILFLLAFVGRRVLMKRRLPFDGFVFLPWSFSCALAGAIWHSLSPEGAHVLVASQQGFILNLILGVGARMIPVICRVPSALTPLSGAAGKKRFEFGLFAVGLNLTVLAEALSWFDWRWVYTLRAVLIALYSVRHLKILQASSTRSFVAWGVRSSMVVIVIGYLASWLTEFRLSALHLVFIGGFALVTLMVAARVTLAHEGRSLDFELRDRGWIGIIFCLLGSAISRFFIESGSAREWLVDLTSIAFIAAIVIWSVNFRKFILPIASREGPAPDG